MKRKLSILYAWLIRTLLFFAPDIPFVMKLRGWLYSRMLPVKPKNFQVAHSTIINSLTNLFVGDNVYLANNVILLAGGTIEIGENTLIAPGVLISSDNHTFDPITGYRFSPVKFERVIIGEGAWVCANSVITKGAVLPAFSILAPSSVLSKIAQGTFKTHALYCGNPATFVKIIQK